MMQEKLNPRTHPNLEWTEQENIPIHGYQQLLDMLRVADPSFRESLLRRVAAKDKNLALSLQRSLFS